MEKTYKFMREMSFEDMKNFVFEGFDWMELYECFGLESESDGEEPIELEDYLRDVCEKAINASEQQDVEAQNVVLACKSFLSALAIDAKKWNGLDPLWKGLREIEIDETFLIVFITLLPMMWN